MNATAAIANHLNVAAEAITEIQEWASVLWVRVKGLGARFVSKKVAEAKEMHQYDARVFRGEFPERITYNYPDGRKMRLDAAINQGYVYKVFVDGRYHSQQSRDAVLKNFESMTEEQKVSAQVVFSYEVNA